jgi:hypothetical protein
MLNLKIYEHEGSDEPVTLRLVKSATGSISVCVVDENGKLRSRGKLIAFYPDGRSVLFRNVNESFGFDLDSKGFLNARKVNLNLME